MRGYLSAWGGRLLLAAARVPARPPRQEPRPKVSPDRLEVLERLASEGRRARRAGPYEAPRRLY